MSGTIDLSQVRTVLGRRVSTELTRPRRAAVALVLSAPQGSLSALLVRRAEREGDPWSGHMALPGGHEHASDHDLLQTARRETQEEVGLDLERAELLGVLDDLSPMRQSSMLVRPYVFWTAEFPPLAASDEVAEMLWIPLADLAGDRLRTTREVTVRSQQLRVPAFVLDERVIWGMTYHLLDSFLTEIRSA